ncbi:MFS general substrate transporter [Mycena kentingensis (nom. inval.)]|nr:MFS general substrate transporter [Mycena kentingensis (nom. inval.)]
MNSNSLADVSNFVDRTAIGNAKIAGLEKDLGMAGFDYNIALTCFYIFVIPSSSFKFSISMNVLQYILADIPSNLMLKKFGSVWLAAMILAFGVVSIGTAFVQSYSGLIATRVFLGIAEGGTLYYPRKELVMRVGVFFGISAPLAGAFGGLLASGLLTVGDIGTVKSWRKIFLIEGIITAGLGLLGFFVIPTDPEHTRMLNEDVEEERALALARIAVDQAVNTHGHKEPTTLRLVWRAFNDNTTFCVICYILVNISFQGLALFMPTVVATLGHFTVVESQLRTVPPYIVAVIWTLFNAWFSMRFRNHALPIIVSALFQIVGYATFVGTTNAHARYAACFLSLFASPTGPLALSWGTANAAPDTVRAVTSAIIPGFGALGSVIAVWTYLPTDAPNYHKGNSLNLGTACAILTLTIIAVLYIRVENGKRERGERDYRLEGKTAKELQELGAWDPLMLRLGLRLHPAPTRRRCFPRLAPLRPLFPVAKRLSTTPPPKQSLKEDIYTLPNLLTLSRIAACPILGYSVLHGDFHIATSLLVYAGLTDFVDGYLARRYKTQTVLGTILDPAADKLLVTTLAVTLTMKGMLPLPLTIIVLGRDVLLSLSAFYIRYTSLAPPKTFARYWDFSLPSAEVRPTLISKVNTALQLVLMGSTTISPLIPTDISIGLQALQYTVGATTIWSGLSYVFSKDAVRLVANRTKPKPPA